ncbi:MAG: hypothetical protein RI947_1583 [Candidatus Parcubacteria bacterium]|jgi:hypothetical protein
MTDTLGDKSVVPRYQTIQGAVAVAHLCALLEIPVIGRNMAELVLAIEHREAWSIIHPTNENLVVTVEAAFDVQQPQPVVIKIWRSFAVDPDATDGANQQFHRATAGWWTLQGSTQSSDPTT